MKITKIFFAIFFSIAVVACGGGGSSSGDGGPSITTIGSMPYSGSVTGTNHSYYKYTTVGTVNSISATALTSDVDPQVYTDASFTTLSTNWTCTNYSGTTADSCTASTTASAGTVLYIKARNYAGTSGSFTLSVTGPAGSPPTITSFTPTSGAPGSSVTITGTNFSATAANNTVKFNGVTASVTSATTTSLTVTVPASASTGTISVATAAGTITSATSFTVSAGGGPSAITIASMPYNGSVTGTNHSYYVYTTVGTVSTISATALTSDIDPQVYTDATFTTLSSNWTCSANSGTTADSCTAITPVTTGTVLYIKARNYAATSGTFTLSVAGSGGGGGTTLTLSFGNVTGLSYDAATSNAATTVPTTYSRVWVNSAGDILDLIYMPSTAEDVLSVAVASGANSYWAGTPTLNIICHVSGSTTSWPLCSTWGITVSRAAGTISFANTPVFNDSSYTTGTMSGSFSFTAF